MERPLRRLSLDGNSLKLADLARCQPGKTTIAIRREALSRVKKSAQTVQKIAAGDAAVYGINTGFGRLKNVRIEQADLVSLQENLLRSHAVGVGDLLAENQAWRLMLLRLNSLLGGHSGCSVELVQLLVQLLNAPLIAAVPSQGSVGASGDLAPLAHMALVVMGEGEVLRKGKPVTARGALKNAGIAPHQLQAKEGLALINGTQFMTTVLVEALVRLREASVAADVIGALTLDALLGTDRAFDARLHKARGQVGQIKVAARLRKLLSDSQLKTSHEDCDRVQDAYSLRCMPQVHGAALDVMSHVTGIVSRELNAVTDNPLVLGRDVISGGNFHGEPVALAADCLKLAVAEWASISERRIEQLVNPDLSHLPAFLVEEGGLNSGYMMAQVTAAALVSENKVLAHPASVDSIPTSANQEDHVSMGPIGARQVLQMTGHLENVLAIELLCACQALDLRRPLKSSALLEKVRRAFRKQVPMLRQDRRLSHDVGKAQKFIASGAIRELTDLPGPF